MQLRDVMTHHVKDIPPEATVQEAAKAMRELDVGALPVCDHDKLIGIITDRDIAVRSTAEGHSPDESVREAMTPEFIYCFEDEDVEAAAQLMEEKHIRRLPVLDRQMKLCGIVSLGDIATRQSSEHLSAEVLQQVSQPNQPHA